MQRVRITKLSDQPCIMEYIGHVNNVISGKVPNELLNRRFRASDFSFGFEAGSPQGIFNIGEGIMFNDVFYSSRTDFTRKQRDPLMWGPEFVTPGIFLVPKSQMPNYSIEFCTLEKYISFKELYRELYKKFRGPFAIAGCSELSHLRSMSITFSPIEHENIFEHKDKYFSEKERTIDNISVAFMGVVSNINDAHVKNLNKKLKSVLYYNPYNKQDPETVSHTHALTLSKPIVEINNIEPHDAVDVIHVTDDSMIRYIKATVFLIEDIIKHKLD